MKKFVILLITILVVWLAAGYHHARKEQLGEALITAAYYGDLLSVKEALEDGAPSAYTLFFDDEDRQYSEMNFNALQAAASGGNEDVINFLLDQDFDINIPTPDGWTPLYIAARDGQAEAAKLLVFREADLNIQTHLGATALIMALTQPFETEQARTDLLTYMLKRGANPNLADNAGFSPLYYAAATLDPARVQILLENGAKATPEQLDKILKMLQLKGGKNAKKIAALLKKKAAK